MAEDGYDGATIQSIAAKAKLTPGLVHYHFHSKLDILLALLEHLSKKLEERYRKLLAGQSDAEHELTAFVNAHLAIGEDADVSAVACWIAIGAEALRVKEVRELYQSISASKITELEHIVERVLKKRKKNLNTKRAIALGIFAAIEGSYRMLVSAPELLEPGFAAPTVLAMAKGAIEAQSPRT